MEWSPLKNVHVEEQNFNDSKKFLAAIHDSRYANYFKTKYL